jgi:hypothetical protein
MVGTILDISELKRMQERDTEHLMLKKALEDVSTLYTYIYITTSHVIILSSSVLAVHFVLSVYTIYYSL